jgi:hypothetical protein
MESDLEENAIRLLAPQGDGRAAHAVSRRTAEHAVKIALDPRPRDQPEIKHPAAFAADD